jgi:ribonuclease VapC
MVVDTSAIIAIIFDEPEAALFSEKISRAERRRISAATLVEASIVLKRQTKSGDDRDLDAFLTAAPFEIVPFDQSQATIARRAYMQFGQASGHPARLNFGDCFAYALARELSAPLLFKGDDFPRTDVERA